MSNIKITISERERKLLVMALSVLAGADRENELISEITDLTIKIAGEKQS